jgi:hypothetical protein
MTRNFHSRPHLNELSLFRVGKWWPKKCVGYFEIIVETPIYSRVNDLNRKVKQLLQSNKHVHGEIGSWFGAVQTIVVVRRTHNCESFELRMYQYFGLIYCHFHAAAITKFRRT